MSHILPIYLLAVPLLYTSLCAADTAPREWPVYGGGPEGIRHSTLTQINRSNVGQLTMAWSYDALDGPGGLQTNPIIVGGALYLTRLRPPVGSSASAAS